MGAIFTRPDPQGEEIGKQLSLPDFWQIDTVYQQGSPLCVKKRGNACKITYGQRCELFRGLGLLAEHRDEEVYEISQAPYFTMNGAMLDCSRNGVVNLDAAKRMIRYLALMGHNLLMLYTEDTYEVPEYPYFGYKRGRYSQKELQELDAYAQSYGVEMIPCMQTLAHLATTLRWQCFEEIKDTEDILLVGEEKTYDFIEAMIRACRNCYHTDRILIGMDEAFMLGFGRYRVKNGIQNREEIFCQHLARVNEICKKYGFRAMIWSDMFYRLAFGGDYNADSEISRQVREMVPADVALVYWEYERFTKEDYIAPLESHKQFGSNPVFAGSSWRWLGFAPHTEKSLEASRAALAACRETGVREVICTAWGDQGNECPIFAILPTLQLFAELSYQENIDEAALASRLLACTGENYNDLLLMDKPDMPDGKFRRIITDPCTYLLFSDVLDGVFELHSEPCYRENYARYAAQLAEAAQRSQNHGYMYDMLAKLCAVLELKSCVGADAYAAYQAGDKAALQTIATEVLPELLERMEAFRETVEVRWLAEYKLSGYEVQDLRLGGVSARVKTAIRRLNGYLNGELERLEELEEERLPFHCVSREELEKERVICWNIRRHQFTANNL